MNDRPVRFGFDEVGPFDGFTDGSTWNGWLNIYVTKETHAKVVAEFAAFREGCNLDTCEEDLEFDNLEADENGMVSYALGYTTSEWQEDEPTPYQVWINSREKRENLGEFVEEMDGCEGLMYEGGSWIEARKTADGHAWRFSTIVGNQEFDSPYLGAVEWWLWQTWIDGSEPQDTNTIESAIRAAQEAFWAEIAKQYPTATSGDFPSDATIEFDEACTLAVKTWTHYNLQENSP